MKSNAQIIQYCAKEKSWWTPECSEAKRVLRWYPTYTIIMNFKQAKAKARYIRRQAEKSSWKKSGSNGSIVGYIQARLFTVPVLLREQADMLGKHFDNISSLANYSDTQTAEKQRLPITDPSSEAYYCPITLQELNRVLLNGKETAVGPDRIHYTKLAHLSPASTEAVLKFFSRLWEPGLMPEQWKNAIVAPFLKSGKAPTSPSI